MKKLILFISIFLFPLVVNAGSDMYQDLYIEDDGDILVKEAIKLDGTYNGFELSLVYKYFDEFQIYSADSMELIRVCEASGNEFDLFDNVTNCFTEVNYASNGDSRVYIYSNISNGSTIRMYNPSTSFSDYFYIEYLLKNVVVKHNDIAELRLNILDSTFSEYLNDFKMKIHLPGKDSDFRIWGHGPLYGETDRENNDTGIVSVTDLDSETMIDVRMTFNTELIPDSSKYSNIDNFNNILSEEEELAKTANEAREEAKKKEDIENALYIASLVMSGMWIVGLIFVWIRTYKKYDKEYASDFNEKYFRDFPADYSPEIVQYLMDKKVNTLGMSSSILNIIRKKGLIIEEENSKKGILKKEVKEYKLILNNELLKEKLTDEEEMLRSWLVSEYGDGTAFYISDLSKKITNETKAKAFMKKYNEWIDASKTKAISEEFYEDNAKKKALPVLYALIPAIFIVFGMFVFAILIPFGLAFLIYIITFSKRTKKGNDHYKKWNALKAFLIDFGTFKDKELPEIHLWEKY
jgi:uncharacterized membrane protein